MTTITETDFLLARVAEDEAAARDVFRAEHWRVESDWREDRSELVGGGKILASFSDEDRLAALHVERWGPSRVLAECAAKRRIVELHTNWPVLVERPEPEVASANSGDIYTTTLRMSRRIAWATEQEYRNRFGEEPPTSPIIRALVQPYADHPDFQDDWRV